MRVESKEDLQDSPEECDSCGSSEAALERFYYYGPGHNVDWLCPYCCRCHWRSEPVLRGIAGMLNHFEYRIKAALEAGDENSDA